MSTINITPLSSICNAHFMQQGASKWSRYTKVPLPLGGDKEGKRFFLPRQMACVKDHTELILHKEKVVFRDTLYCFKCIYAETSRIFYRPSCTKAVYFDICERASSNVEQLLNLCNCVSVQIVESSIFPSLWKGLYWNCHWTIFLKEIFCQGTSLPV